MTEVKLSIIIPHYNSADFLNKLLSTIPNIPEIQTIVVDDHSTEKLGELEKCKETYSNGNIEFYLNEYTKSAGGARNTGLKYAKGKWLLFADADDYFLPEFYGKVAAFFEKDLDLVYFLCTSIDISTQKEADRHIYQNQLLYDYIKEPSKRHYLRLKYHYFSPCAKLVRRELFDKYNIKFDEIMVANDVMCAIKLAFHAENIKVVEEGIYCITKQPGTLTSTITEERFDARMEVFYRRFQYLKENLPRSEYRLMRFGARVRLQQIKRYNFGRRKYFAVLWEMLRYGVPLWREFSPSYYYDVYIRRRNAK